jgi:hypothetical protein
METKKTKIETIIISIFGGVDTVVYITTPIFLSLLWITIFNLNNYSTYFFQVIGLLSTLFRAYKVGWLKR